MENKTLIADFCAALARCGWHKFIHRNMPRNRHAFVKPIGFVCLIAQLTTAETEDPVFELSCLIVSTDFDQESLEAWKAFESMRSSCLRAETINLKHLHQNIEDSLHETDNAYHKSWEWEIKFCEEQLVRNMEAPVICKQNRIGKRWLIARIVPEEY